jgi:hypothetical protein
MIGEGLRAVCLPRADQGPIVLSTRASSYPSQRQGPRGISEPRSAGARNACPGRGSSLARPLIPAASSWRTQPWRPRASLRSSGAIISSRTAVFRQIDKDVPQVHHDALEFPDGTFVLLTDLHEGQQALARRGYGNHRLCRAVLPCRAWRLRERVGSGKGSARSSM